MGGYCTLFADDTAAMTVNTSNCAGGVIALLTVGTGTTAAIPTKELLQVDIPLAKPLPKWIILDGERSDEQVWSEK